MPLNFNPKIAKEREYSGSKIGYHGNGTRNNRCKSLIDYSKKQNLKPLCSKYVFY